MKEDHWDREERLLHKAYEDGDISKEELREEMAILRASYRDTMSEQFREAFDQGVY